MRTTRRTFLGGLAAAVSPAPSAKREGPPNIVLVMADDFSARELACYGHREHKTPQLDRLADTGVRFRTCWASPICSPSRAELMTGRYAYRTQWFHNQLKLNEPLCEKHLTIGQALHRAGYATAITGKWQLPGTYAAHGFDEHLMWVERTKEFDGPVEQEGHLQPGRTARYWHPCMTHNGKLVRTSAGDYGPDLSLDFISDFMARNRTRPFFVYYPMVLTHSSWDFDLNRAGYLAAPRLDSSGKRAAGKSEHTFRANVEYLDYQMGRLTAALDRLALREDTIILFTGDNGTSLYGKTKVDGEKGPRVPMIVNGPGRVKAVGPCDELVDLSDVLPTLVDLAGSKLPYGYALDGKSFAPALRGETGKGRDWIYSVYATHRFVRDKRWLLDGAGHLYDCGDNRDETGYQDVTGSGSREVAAARRRLDAVLAKLPGPPEHMRRQWERLQAESGKKRAARE